MQCRGLLVATLALYAGHIESYTPGMKPRVRRPLVDRFWEKVNKTDTCWIWTACKTAAGYGYFAIGHSGPQYAHRLAYQLANPISLKGLQLHHICKNRACVNPSHLEVTDNLSHPDGAAGVNRQKTHCKHGHELSGNNLYVKSNGSRECIACINRRAAEYQTRKRHVRSSLMG
jgi:hypothetical protein